MSAITSESDRLAKAIDAHLKRFEQDPKINAPRGGEGGTLPYYHAGAWCSGGRWIRVMYVSYQGSTALTRAQATAYLAKLDAGFVGRHHEALREEKKP